MNDAGTGREQESDGTSLNRLAASATTHCMTGCAIGEVLGLVISQTMGWGKVASIGITVLLAFFFGYPLTMLPLPRSGIAFAAATGMALAADTASIKVMEIVDNAIMPVIPGAMTAGLASPIFWGSPALGLGLAWVAAFPVNRWLIVRSRSRRGLRTSSLTETGNGPRTLIGGNSRPGAVACIETRA